MVSIKVDAGKVREFEIGGNLDIITLEVAFAIGLIYEQIKKNNKDFLERLLGGEEDD